MDLIQMKAVIALSRSGSFTSAARTLGLTQSALSQQIQRLERELRTQLFLRARPATVPTEAGRIFIAAADRALAELEAAEQRIEEIGRGTALRIAATTLGVELLNCGLIDSFLVKYPEYKIALTATETIDEAVRRVIHRQADFVFGPLTFKATKSIKCTRLGDTEYVVVVRSSDGLAKKAGISLDQLNGRKIVLYEPGSGSRALTDRLFRGSRSRPNIAAQSNDTNFIKHLISNHCVAALMPVFSVVAELRNGSFSAIRLNSETTLQDFGLGHLSDNGAPAVKAFKEHCFAACGATWHLTLDQIGSLTSGIAGQHRNTSTASALSPSA